MNVTRAMLVAAALVATSAFTAIRTAPAPRPVALDSLSTNLGAWHGTEAPGLDAATRRELAADAYVTRTYETGAAAAVGLYIAYYTQQRPNVSIHSPLHCLPGTGWEPLEVSTIDLSTDSTFQARRLLVRKNLNRAVVLYWYAIHGRNIAGEFASRFWLLRDSLLFGRSDAALVRVTAPVQSSIAAADRDADAFARALAPHVTF